MRFRPPYGFRYRLARFFMGRNGADTLYYVSLALALVFVLCMRVFRESERLNAIFFVLYLLFFGYALFRFFSRNVAKRRRENIAFRHLLGKLNAPISRARIRLRDRKTHLFRKCPKCKNTLRLKRIPGEHTVRCPACGNRFSVKVKK